MAHTDDTVFVVCGRANNMNGGGGGGLYAMNKISNKETWGTRLCYGWTNATLMLEYKDKLYLICCRDRGCGGGLYEVDPLKPVDHGRYICEGWRNATCMT